MDNCYTVYVHISPSGKRYYGSTCQQVTKRRLNGMGYIKNEHFYRCQVYTSDDADEQLCVDIGGYRNIKKTNKKNNTQTKHKYNLKKD